jgi:threonylcarbamoyladenosine tRNA methylthiotransferase MtaB
MHLLANKLKNNFLQSQLNQSIDILWESQKPEKDGWVRYSGYTPNFCKVETIVANTVLLESRIKKAKLVDFSEDRGIFQGVHQDI